MAKKKQQQQSRDTSAPTPSSPATFPQEAAVNGSNVLALRVLGVLIVVVLLVISFFLGRASANLGAKSQGSPVANPTADSTLPTPNSSSASGDLFTPLDSETAKSIVKKFVGETGLIPGEDFATSITADKGASSLLEIAKSVDTPQRTLGSPKAPLTMTVMSDFSCPMCTLWETKNLPQLQKYIDNGTLRLQWYNLVIFAQQYGSDWAAHASIAAQNQNKLWDFVHTAYATAGDGNHPTYDEEEVMQIAKQAGIPDLAAFKTDMNSEETRSQVERETSNAHALGVNGTPFFILGDSVISGVQPATFFENTIAYQQFRAAHAG